MQTFELPSGVSVLLTESYARPMVEMRLLIRAGAGYDDEGREGTAALTGAMLDEGSGELDGGAFRERLDYHGIVFGVQVDQDAMRLSMTVLGDYLEEALERLGDIILRPRFEGRPLEQERAKLRTRLIKEGEQPDHLASRALNRLMFTGHRYGRPSSGSQESLARITLEDIIRHHRLGFRGPEMVLAVAGAVTRERLQSLLLRTFATLEAAPSPWPAVPTALMGMAGASAHHDLEVPQTSIRLGWVALDRDDADYYPLVVLNHILGGGGFGSRLTEALREKRGLTYGIYTYFSPLAGRGPMVIGMQTKKGSTLEALQVIREELDQLREGGVGEPELSEAKQDLIGSFPLQLDGLGKLAIHWATVGFYRRGLDYLDRWPERIQAVTAEEVTRVARRLLTSTTMNQVTVGPVNPLTAGGVEAKGR